MDASEGHSLELAVSRGPSYSEEFPPLVASKQTATAAQVSYQLHALSWYLNAAI